MSGGQNDLDTLIKRINMLERLVAQSVRWGVVKKVEKGRIRVDWNGNQQGQGGQQGASGGQGASGQSEGEDLSPWLRTGQQNGWMTQHVPYEVGQMVAVMSQNGDFSQSLVFPHSHWDNRPLAKDADTQVATTRIRKPLGNATNDNAGYGESKKDDDENDFMAEQSYSKHFMKKGKASIRMERTGEGKDGKATQQSGGQQGPQQKKEEIELKVDDARIYIAKGMIVIEVGGSKWTITPQELVSTGVTRLNNGKKQVHRIGDIDSDGDIAVTGAPGVFA